MNNTVMTALALLLLAMGSVAVTTVSAKVDVS